MKLNYPCIQFQVFGRDWLQCAQSIASIGPEVFIKIPANKQGLEVASKLSVPDRITLTAVYSVGQVIAAEALQVAYTAPYYARLRDAIENADALFDQMQNVAFETELLVASLQSKAQFLDLAARGFSTFALPEPIARTFFESTLADKAIADFEVQHHRCQKLAQKKSPRPLPASVVPWSTLRVYSSHRRHVTLKAVCLLIVTR